jgi:ribosomal protein S18 acetylase RimI-like enzyme
MKQYLLRQSTTGDKPGILDLYLNVSGNIGGLARTSEEITYDYVDTFTSKASKNGMQFVIQCQRSGSILGEIHCYKLEPKVFNHILSELTIAVLPEFQGQGLGRMLFQHLLHKVCEERRDILRVELIARESNQRAIAFYQKLGFRVEGRLLNRVKGTATFEADIPMAWMNDRFESPHYDKALI